MIDAIGDEIRALIKHVDADLTAVINAQNTGRAASPRPALPYASIRWLTTSERAQYNRSEIQATKVVHTSKVYRERVLRAYYYGPDAFARAETFVSSTTWPTVLAYLDAVRINSHNPALRLALRNATIGDTSGLRDTTFEESAYVDVLVSWIDTNEQESEPIETVTVKGAGDLDFEFTVDLT